MTEKYKDMIFLNVVVMLW